MAEEYKLHIRTTGDPSGAELTQDALEATAQEAESIVDAVTKGDRATAALIGKLRQLTPEQIEKVEREMRQLIAATEEAGKDATALRAQLQNVASVNLDKQAKAVGGIFGGVLGGTLAAQAISSATTAIGNHLRASVELADQTEDLAGRAGVAAEELHRIGNAAGRNNVSIQGTAEALSKLRISAQDAGDGNKALREGFDSLGISIDELKSLTPEQLFYRISDAVATSSDKGRTYATVVDLMGRGSKDLFTTMELGSEQIRKLGDNIGKFNSETSKALAEANDALEEFQNKLTIGAGKFIEIVGTGYKEYYRQLTMTEPEIQKLVQAENDAAAGAAEARKQANAAAGAVEKMGDSAGSATTDLKNLEAVSRQFADRSRARLPLAEQLELLRLEIERIRRDAEHELPGLKFADAGALFELSKTASLSKEARQRVIELAVEYAGYEDKLKQVSETDQKLQPDRKKRLDEIRVELAKPNILIADRNKLLEEEVKLLRAVTTAAENRAKAEQAPAPASKPKPLSDPAALARSDAALEARSRGGAGNDLNELQRKVDERARAAQLELAGAIDQIPRAIGDIQKVSKQGFDEISVALQLVPAAFTEAVEPVKQSVVDANGMMQGEIQRVGDVILELGGTITIGFAGLAGNIQGVNANLQRQINGIEGQIAALWKQV